MNMIISNEYKKLNKILHNRPRGFGGGGHKWVNGGRPMQLPALIKGYNLSSMLDYGCGQSLLWKNLEPLFPDMKYAEFDPCYEGKDVLPEGVFELVVCTDVLEHVEPEFLESTISRIFDYATRMVFLNVSMVESNKDLPDGRNSHLIQEPWEWWEQVIYENISHEWKLDEVIFQYCKRRKKNKDFTARYVKCAK